MPNSGTYDHKVVSGNEAFCKPLKRYSREAVEVSEVIILG